MGATDYRTWNDAIANHYLGGEWRNRPLYLDLDKGKLQSIAAQVDEQISDPQAAFSQAVGRTLMAANSGYETFYIHTRSLDQWMRSGQSGPPPFLGLLAFFALVASSMASDEQFSQANYYARLAQALGVAGNRRRKREIQRGFADQSHIFWDALNKLLTDEDGRLGWPTAFAFDRRVHVSIPISQALVREEDRRRLPELFAHYELAPGSFPVSEMVGLLDEWIARSSVSVSLHHLWQSPGDVRERIAAVACHELESWDGVIAQSDAQGLRRVPIRLVASVRSHPRPRLDLDLRVRISDSRLNRTLSLGAGADGATQAALKLCNNSVTLIDSGLDGWGEFDESDRISMADVLLANMALRDREGRTELARRARQIVILAFDQEQQWHVEVDRASLVASHTLLVRPRLERNVLEFVRQCARPGWKRFDAQSMIGCPEGWTLIRGVALMAAPDVASDDLQPLVPSASAAIAFTGGLALPRRNTWHAALPPEVSFSVGTEKTISAVLHPIHQEAAEVPLGQFVRSGVVQLREHEVPAGEYRVAVYELDKSARRSPRSIASSTLRLRSAETAGPPDPIESLRRPIHEDSRWAAISAVHSPAASAGPMVAGGFVELDSKPEEIGPLPPTHLDHADHKDELEEPPIRSSRARSGLAPPCFDGGAHHWDLGMGVANEKRRRRGSCKHCGLVRWHGPTRKPRSARAGVVSRGSERPIPRSPQVVVEAIDDESLVDLDTLLNAISLLNEGTWASFVALARNADDRPWFASEFARTLAGLGHIELRLNRTTLRVERWAVGPPVLVGLPDRDTAVLAGFRSRRLLDRLKASVKALGGSLAREEVHGAPMQVMVRGLRHQERAYVTESATNALGFAVHSVEDAAARLLTGLPPITELLDALFQWHLPDGEVERFDITTGRWAPTDQSTMPGAYRTHSFPRTYAFVPRTTNSRPTARLGTVHLVKHLESLRTGVPLVAYDPKRCELVVRLGAQLPGLYERVAMLCSGSPPRRFNDGTQRYANVPPGIAAGLWSRLQQPGRSA